MLVASLLEILSMKRQYHELIFTEIDVKGGKDGNPPDLASIFFESGNKDNNLLETEAIKKMYIW